MWRFTAAIAAALLALPLTSIPTPAPRHPAGPPAVHMAGDRPTATERQEVEIHLLRAQVAEVTAQRDQAQATAAELQRRIDALEAEAASRGGIGGGPTAGAPAGAGNHFPYGWCTWWVASKRWVPWFGNAISWLYGARMFGFPVGAVPRAGAIMVTAESSYGHVAYVESVSSSGSFLVSEMNYAGWGLVDVRMVLPGRAPILGFIY